MAIVIFGDNFFFPEGDASTNRVYTYANGLSENGTDVHVVCFANEFIEKGEGNVKDINYYHPFGQAERHKYFLVRRWQKFIKYFKTIALFRRISKKEKITSVIVYTMRLSTHLFGWYLSRISGAKLVMECSEHPLIYYQKGFLKKTEGKIKVYLESRFTDGILCISRFLIDFFKSEGVPESRLMLLPSTVDTGRFTEKVDRPVPYSYIGYFGGLTFNRDNIDVLVRAFALITDKHPDIHLVIGGFCSDSERQKLENLIVELNVSPKTNLLKYLPRTEILKYIIHSDILVMVRARDLETQASFPSKLTEYLATLKPVVTVNVGEIPDFLTDGVNAYLVEPGDSDALARKLDYVLNNYNQALEIAKQGKQLTETVFNHNYQAKRMMQFMESLQKHT